MKTPLASCIGLAGLLATALLIPVVSAQNVGIGTSSPQSKLSVDGSTASGGIAVGDASYTSTPGTVAPLNGAIIQGFAGIGTSSPFSRLTLQGDDTALSSTVIVNSTANPPTGAATPQVVLRVSDNSGLAADQISGRFIVQSLPGGTQANPTGMDALHRGFSGGPLTALRFQTCNGLGPFERMRIDEAGNVGIGTPTPLAPLHVTSASGSVTRGAGDARNLSPNFGTGLFNIATTDNLGAVSIYANGRIVSGTQMLANLFQAAQSFTASDERTKDIIGASDSAMDLETLKRLQITDYTMKDKSLLGDKRFKKVIAQEVEEVFPQAVSQTEKAIPDVMQPGVAKEISEGRFQVSFADATDLKAGEFVEIFDKDRTPQVVRVESVEGNAITVALRSVKEGEEVFVYGRRVDDFGIVDYEALSMLNISATQELVKKIAALEAENERLKAKVDRFDVLAARLDALEERPVARTAEAGGGTVLISK